MEKVTRPNYTQLDTDLTQAIALTNDVKKKLANYPVEIILSSFCKQFLPDDFPDPAGKLTVPQQKIYAAIRDNVIKVIDWMKMYKTIEFGHYKLEVPDAPQKFVKVEQQTEIPEVTSKRGVGRPKKIQPIVEKDEFEVPDSPFAISQRLRELNTALQDPENNTDQILSIEREIKFLEDIIDNLSVIDEHDSVNEEDYDVEESEEDDGTFEVEVLPKQEEVESGRKPKSSLEIEKKSIKSTHMYLIDLIQFIVDNQPRGTRVAEHTIEREDFHLLLTDILSMYKGREEDPTPDDIADVLKLWFEDVQFTSDIIKSEYRVYCHDILRWYYNTYTGIEQKLKNMLALI